MAEAVFKLRVTVEPDDRVETVADASLVKTVQEQKYALFVAYPVNKADVSVAADGHRDFASPDVIEKACWNWMRKGCPVGLWHQSGFEDQFECVENYVYRGPTWVQKCADGSEQKIEPGDWLAAYIAKTDEAWALITSGKVGGSSPQGSARRRTPSQESLAQLRS